MSPIRPENRGRYPKDWKQIRARILKRAGYRAADFDAEDYGAPARCECLGECARHTHTGRCPNVQYGIAYGTEGEGEFGMGTMVVLTIAHLDHTPEHNDDENLRAMCQGCHLHYDREHHAQTRRETRRRDLEMAGQETLPL